MRLKRGAVIDGVDRVCKSNLWHPIRQYLETLPEPQHRGYLDCWLTQFLKAEGDAEYLRQVGRKWLICAVARVMEPGCQADHALILEGPQGYGKSSALRILAGDDFFGDSLPDFHDKAASEYLPGKWLIEMAELTGLRRSEVEINAELPDTSRGKLSARLRAAGYQLQTPVCVFGIDQPR